MAQDHTKKEALFNEVKGSLFEYLVAREIAVKGAGELLFHESLGRNYLTVLSQQDRMVRQFYPEMLPFLNQVSKLAASSLINYLQVTPIDPRVVGKFSNSSLSDEIHEADLILRVKETLLPVSLKLNKKNAFVNTKSGGIKSFFTQYFSFISPAVQQDFNQFVDMEFNRMALELHALHDLEFTGNFQQWGQKGYSELPGELDEESRKILKSYYSRIAQEIHRILGQALFENTEHLKKSLPTLMGFGNSKILQVICYHDFPQGQDHSILIHSYEEVASQLDKTELKPFGDISSVEFSLGNWTLQIRVKPMNKFTTTAIKINCSVKSK